MNGSGHTMEAPPSGYLDSGPEVIDGSFVDVEAVAQSRYFTVWRARRYGRWWALKGLNDEYAASETHRLMLRKEFEVLMRLQHPLVVQATGLEEVDGCGRCIVMEWVDGVPLDRWIEATADAAARRRVLAMLLEAVAYVHRHGVVHRDLKPANVLVTGGGSGVRLIDFSLADCGSYAVLKQAGGTAGYVSPEQLDGGAPDVRNDIYSLGVVMRQMALGSRYDSVIARCVAPIERRYGSVGELQQAVTATGRPRRWRLVVAAAVAVAAVAVAVTWSSSVTSHPTAVAVVAADATHDDSVARQQQSLSAMRDSMTRLSVDNCQLQEVVDQMQQSQEQERRQQAERRSQFVNQAVERGRHAIDLAAARTSVGAHLDTLSSAAYLNEAVLNAGIQAIRGAAVDYMVSIQRNFSAEERETIRRACQDHVNDVTYKWLTRVNRGI